MRRIAWMTAALVMALAAMILTMTTAPGCVYRERAALRTATDSYAATLDTLAEYRAAGLLDENTIAEVDAARVIVRAALDEWRVAIADGEDTDGPRRAFRAALDRLIAAQIAAAAKQRE